MSSLTFPSIEDLREVAETGQCGNAFFQQEQLEGLYETLCQNATKLVDAIEQDTYISKEEAKTEFALAVRVVKDHYESIDTKAELEEADSIANGETSRCRRVPWGIVYIETDLSHTPFFNVVSALSASIAAGNCVALKLENDLRALSSLLRNLLPRALGANSFSILKSAPAAPLPRNILKVLQSNVILYSTKPELESFPGRSIAIIDRTADLESAAQSLVAARFAFGGNSPYAPDIIFVNEYVKEDFINSLVQYAMPFFIRSSNDTLFANSSSEHETSGLRRGDYFHECLDKLVKDNRFETNIVTRGSKNAIIELRSQSYQSSFVPDKIAAPILLVSAITSMDHAIDLISSYPTDFLLAAYHFAVPSHATYLTKYVFADVTFINDIPAQLLVGPAAPKSRSFNLQNRYMKDHFMRDLTCFPSKSIDKTNLISLSDDGQPRDAKTLLTEAMKGLKNQKRAEWIAHGFFEQGIFIGLSLYGIPVLTCLGFSAFYTVKAGLNLLRPRHEGFF